MPDAKNNTKLTGDTHMPEVESDQPLQQGNGNPLGSPGTASDRGRSTELGMEGRPGRGINQAGLLKDKDADDDRDGTSGDETSER